MKTVSVGDFETLTYEPTRVWLWCLTRIEDLTSVTGTTIESFFNELLNHDKVYFHNLAFDGNFIIPYLEKNGFTHMEKLGGFKSYSTLISKENVFYSIKIKIGSHIVTILDSYKVLPMSEKNIAKSFNLPLAKGSIEYDKIRPIDYEPTAEEIQYVIDDTVIVALALKEQFEQGLKKMTLASNALNVFKKGFEKQDFDRYFPILDLEVDKEIRASYKGGYCYVNPKYQNKLIRNGIVLDANSMYPYQMKTKPLPYGQPVKFMGEYVYDEIYNLYIVNINASFTLKENHLPTLQIKNSPFYSATQYVTEALDPVNLTLTSVDYELLKKHYDIHYIEHVYGYKMKSNVGFFDEYINYWYHIKQTETGGKRQIAKLMLNALYGKFAKNPDTTRKTPTLNDDNIIEYRIIKHEITEPFYIPMGSFITAYAREHVITNAQNNYDRFIYSDTDSIHLVGTQVPIMDIDDERLGAWGIEEYFTYAKYLRAKRYIHMTDGKTKVTCAGMPDNVKEKVTFSNFKSGVSFYGKLLPKIVEDGVLLQPTTFKLL